MVRQVEGQFNGGLTRALTIARTETLDAYRQAAAAVQDASRDVLEGWVWLAQLDGRGCPACWAMHGTVHPLDEPGPLGHPNCRCSRAPKTQSWRDLGFDMDEPEDQIPDAEQVFQALPRAVQVRIMGPARLGLLDRGEVSWPDLARRKDNPGWRPSWMPVPVQDLAATG
jgi:SPP1 gp7 family putative phage head morphogenesis protein